MISLTERQLNLLKAVIEEYIETAKPVGSESLEKKYNLGASPATIRNEMVKLTKMGFLKKPHTSAGRSPTPLALKFYVKELMKPKELSVAEEVGLKEQIWDYRFDRENFLRHATKTLAEKTKNLSLAATDEGNIYYAGAANILDMPEFFDIDLTRNLLLLLDEVDFWHNLIERGQESPEPIHILLGNDLGYDYLEPCGFVYSRFTADRKHKGAIGIVGANRLNFRHVIPLVSYFGDLITKVLSA